MYLSATVSPSCRPLLCGGSAELVSHLAVSEHLCNDGSVKWQSTYLLSLSQVPQLFLVSGEVLPFLAIVIAEADHGALAVMSLDILLKVLYRDVYVRQAAQSNLLSRKTFLAVLSYIA